MCVHSFRQPQSSETSFLFFSTFFFLLSKQSCSILSVLRNICICNPKFSNFFSPSFRHYHDLFMDYMDLVFLNTNGWASLRAQLVKNPRSPWFDSWVGKVCWRRDRLPTPVFLGFPCGSAGKESACNVRVLGSIPGLGRSPGEGNSYSLHYSGLENSMDYIVHGVARGRHDWATFAIERNQDGTECIPSLEGAA